MRSFYQLVSSRGLRTSNTTLEHLSIIQLQNTRLQNTQKSKNYAAKKRKYTGFGGIFERFISHSHRHR